MGNLIQIQSKSRPISWVHSLIFTEDESLIQKYIDEMIRNRENA